MATFFTADTHVGYTLILRRRTALSAFAAHDASLIVAWSEGVEPDDEIRHVGGFAAGASRMERAGNFADPKLRRCRDEEQARIAGGEAETRSIRDGGHDIMVSNFDRKAGYARLLAGRAGATNRKGLAARSGHRPSQMV